MGFEHLRLSLEFSAFTAIFGAIFVWGLATGRTLMKALLAADRTDEPAKYWMGQILYGSWRALCLCVALMETPSRIWIGIVRH